MSTVIGVFKSEGQAKEAVDQLRAKGFSDNEISIIAKDNRNRHGGDEAQNNVGDGTAWGAGIGGGVGLLASAGALAIPGIGPLLALGPLAATLGGATVGGITGGLADWGIPEAEGREFENRVKQGDILAVIKTDKQAGHAAEILRKNGAEDVKQH